MKTVHTIGDVAQFLPTIADDPTNVAQLTEGQVAQAFKYDSLGKTFVLRLSPTKDNFLVDEFAALNFGVQIPIPVINKIGIFDDNTYFCISDFVDSKTLKSLNSAELESLLPVIRKQLADIFLTNIAFEGYGCPDVATGIAPQGSWGAALQALMARPQNHFEESATKIGVDMEVASAFVAQYKKYSPFASEEKSLLHGDPGFDNFLVKNGKVAAVIDWAQLAYGDWMSDFARISFWRDGGYGEALEFADEFGLDNANIFERQKLYWATNALLAIEFADIANNESLKDWLRKNLNSKLEVSHE